MSIRCSMCKVEIPGVHRGSEWGYRLGNSMFFCSYPCMRQKQKLIEEKKAETYAAKALEKQLAKEAKAAKKAASAGAEEIIDKYMAPEEPKEDKPMEDIITVERVVPAEPEFTAKERDIISVAIQEMLNDILPPAFTLEDLLTLCDLVKRLRG